MWKLVFFGAKSIGVCLYTDNAKNIYTYPFLSVYRDNARNTTPILIFSYNEAVCLWCQAKFGVPWEWAHAGFMRMHHYKES
jgi:hypothetical protein